MKTSKSIRTFWLFMVVSFILAYLLMNFVVQPIYVPTSSMEPEISAGSFVLCNKLAYSNELPKRGDVVIFYSKELDENLCKRIIGLPGDTIEVDNGAVYINGKALTENYVVYSDNESFDAIIVPENSYYFLGDNRPSSYDSRYWETPCIDKGKILGKVIL